jgi:hypothetical protein
MKVQKIERSLQLTFIAAIGLIVASCGPNEPAGPEVTEYRDVPAYSRIDIRGSMQVEIVPGNSRDVAITGPDNLMPFIETYVIGDTFVIDEKDNRIKDRGNVRIEISENLLESIEFSGSGSLAGDTIFNSSISVKLSGSGKIDLPVSTVSVDIELSGSGKIVARGYAENITVNLEGSGNVDAKSIEAYTASAYITGSGNVDIFVLHSLFARITGSGEIRFWGNPESVDSNITGSGSLLRM